MHTQHAKPLRNTHSPQLRSAACTAAPAARRAGLQQCSALSTLSDAERKLEDLVGKQDTPLKLGYTMPGEFEPHTGQHPAPASAARRVPVSPCPARLSHTQVLSEPPQQLSDACPHYLSCAACWMGWPGGPDAKYLWREGAKPAEAQYANIAATISQFEPVTFLANPGKVRPAQLYCMLPQSQSTEACLCSLQRRRERP